MLPFGYLDKLLVLQPGDLRFGVPQRDARQYCLGVQQEGKVGGVALDLGLWSDKDMCVLVPA